MQTILFGNARTTTIRRIRSASNVTGRRKKLIRAIKILY